MGYRQKNWILVGCMIMDFLLGGVGGGGEKYRRITLEMKCDLIFIYKSH